MKIMTANNDEIVIRQTKKWINDVVIGCNFCPFAAREMKRNSVVFYVVNNATNKSVLESLARSFEELDGSQDTETIIIILPGAYSNFIQYLNVHELCEDLLTDLKYDGVYQIATFHPAYLFSDTKEDDPSNYTNRSPYPMLHLLRENSVTKALDAFPDAEGIPLKNIAYTKEKGLAYMQALKDSSKDLP